MIMKKIVTLLTLTTLALYGQIFNVSTTPELRTALETAATNGEDDTVILADGTYKTTDDGQGTFIYLSNEDNNLTLKGSSSANVILSGDNVEQIFNHNSTENSLLQLEKLSFVNGNNTAISSNGGGVYTDYRMEVLDCNFTNNSAYNGGGFYSSSKTIVNISTFNSNSASYSGGGFYAGAATVTIKDSTFSSNSASRGGGFYTFATATGVVDSTFINNSALDGGGFYAGPVYITNSSFTSNIASSNGGGFYSSYSTVRITTSAFTNNKASLGDSFYSSSTDIAITNSIFSFNSGISINSFNYAGVAKELNQLTFSVDYTLTESQTISEVAYDYTNSGTYTTIDTHTFNTVGTYTVKVKVTDSEGAFSTSSLRLTIAPLAFTDMTDEQKLVKAIDPTYYDTIVAIIEAKETTANTSGYTLGLYDGKQYVQDNVTEFGLVEKSTIEITSAHVANLSTGWTLVSTPFAITDLSVFDSASVVWVYNNTTASWSAYSSNATTKQKIIDNSSVSLLTSIPAGSGVWVQK